MPLPSTEWDALLKLGRTTSFEAGDELAREGDPSEFLALIVDGRVRISRSSSRGPVAVLGFRGPGTVIGEVGVLTGRTRTVTVAAVEPLIAVLIPASVFRRHLEDRPALSLALLDQLAHWLQDADTRHRDQVSGDATARVAARLLDLAAQWGIDEAGGRRVTLPLTQDELAGYAGASLESTARALRTLRSAGWLQTARREITLLDTPALRARADA